MHSKSRINKQNLGFIKIIALLFLQMLFAFDAAAIAPEHYYTQRDNCIISGNPNPFALGERIAYGENISRKFENLLYGKNFNPNEDVIEPLQVAYAFYLIAERIGDARARARQDWVIPYMPPSFRDRVASAIYQKYSAGFLAKCFASGLKSQNKVNNQNDDEIIKDNNYFLYMYND